MEKSFFCRVLVPIVDDEVPAVSTGYALVRGIVLLARHSLLEEGRDFEQDILLEWCDDHGNVVHEGRITPESKAYFVSLEEDDTADIALVACDDTPPKTPESFNYQYNSSFVAGLPWESYGYPQAEQDNDTSFRYAGTDAGGATCRSGDSGLIALDSNINMQPFVDWAGISGAAVFSGSDLLGVITEGVSSIQHRIKGRSFAYYLEKYPEVFAEPLGIELGSESDKNGYWEVIGPLLESGSLFRLKELYPPSLTSSEQLFEHILSLPVSDFLEKLWMCKKNSESDAEVVGKLGALSEVMLPLFFKNHNIAVIRKDIDGKIVELPYSSTIAAEALMARVDGHKTDYMMDKNKDGEEFLRGNFELYESPEEAANNKTTDAERASTLGAHLCNKFAGDLVQFAADTRLLGKGSFKRNIRRKMSTEDEVEFARMQLTNDRSMGKRRYYIIASDELCSEHYYKQLKMMYPECAVIRPFEGLRQEMKEMNDYKFLEEILAPYLNQK